MKIKTSTETSTLSGYCVDEMILMESDLHLKMNQISEGVWEFESDDVDEVNAVIDELEELFGSGIDIV